MDFPQAIALLTAALEEQKPRRFGSTWIAYHLPRVYRFLRHHVRTDLGHLDWDAVTATLPPYLQRRWMPRRCQRRPYWNASEVHVILGKFPGKRYIFLAPLGEEDERVRDHLCIALVRLAQRGNEGARQELLELLGYTVSDWIERCACLQRWHSCSGDLPGVIDGCIRRYRYTGTFIGYLFRTLEYASRGLPPATLSLDAPILDGNRRRIESVVREEETGELMLYQRV